MVVATQMGLGICRFWADVRPTPLNVQRSHEQLHEPTHRYDTPRTQSYTEPTHRYDTPHTQSYTNEQTHRYDTPRTQSYTETTHQYDTPHTQSYTNEPTHQYDTPRTQSYTNESTHRYDTSRLTGTIHHVRNPTPTSRPTGTTHYTRNPTPMSQRTGTIRANSPVRYTESTHRYNTPRTQSYTNKPTHWYNSTPCQLTSMIHHVHNPTSASIVLASVAAASTKPTNQNRLKQHNKYTAVYTVFIGEIYLSK